MKSIVAFVLGATIVGVSSGVIASDVETYNHENGLWCEQYASVHSYCDREVLTFMQENMLYN